jgi:hypothetical protein
MRAVSKFTWAQQHHRIRTPRPLIENKLYKVHNRKEWWRERRIAPDTFVGFPDPFRLSNIGFSLYTRKMTPAVLCLFVQNITLCQEEISSSTRHQLCSAIKSVALKLTVAQTVFLISSLQKLRIDDPELMVTLKNAFQLGIHTASISDCSLFLGCLSRIDKSGLTSVLERTDFLLRSRTDHSSDELLVCVSSLLEIESRGFIAVSAALNTCLHFLRSVNYECTRINLLISFIKASATSYRKNELALASKIFEKLLRDADNIQTRDLPLLVLFKPNSVSPEVLLRIGTLIRDRSLYLNDPVIFAGILLACDRLADIKLLTSLPASLQEEKLLLLASSHPFLVANLFLDLRTDSLCTRLFHRGRVLLDAYYVMIKLISSDQNTAIIDWINSFNMKLSVRFSNESANSLVTQRIMNTLNIIRSAYRNPQEIRLIELSNQRKNLEKNLDY